MTSCRKWRILPYLDLKKQISREGFIQSWRTIPFFSSLNQVLLDSVTNFSAFGHPKIDVVRVPLNFLNIGYYEVIVTSQRVRHISDLTPYFFWKLIPSPFQRYITCYINKNYSRERIFLQMDPDYYNDLCIVRYNYPYGWTMCYYTHVVFYRHQYIFSELQWFLNLTTLFTNFYNFAVLIFTANSYVLKFYPSPCLLGRWNCLLKFRLISRLLRDVRRIQ